MLKINGDGRAVLKLLMSGRPLASIGLRRPRMYDSCSGVIFVPMDLDPDWKESVKKFIASGEYGKVYESITGQRLSDPYESIVGNPPWLKQCPSSSANTSTSGYVGDFGGGDHFFGGSGSGSSGGGGGGRRDIPVTYPTEGGKIFYKGGQFVPGGGRAPKNGGYY